VHMPIDLNDETRSQAAEIDHVASDRMLPPEL